MRIGKLAILDNLPIHIVWELIDANPGYLPWWEMMARPAPEPENIMTADYIEELVAGASATQSVDIFHPAVLEEYRRNWADPSHVHAYCEDYRAGAGPDVIADKDDIDAGRRIECPVLVLCSKLVFGKADEQPVDVWRRTFAPDVRGKLLDCGHFLTEEKPEETLAELSGFLDSADGKAS